MHGVGVDTPITWQPDALRCGRPIHNTVVVAGSTFLIEDCDYLPRPRVSVAWIGAYDAEPLSRRAILGEAELGRRGLAGLRHATVSGEPALVGVRPSINGGVAHLVLFPHRRVYVSVRSEDPATVRQVLASIRTVRVDPATRCRVHTRQYDDPARLPHQRGELLVPGNPSSVTACGYVDDYLEQTATMTGTRLRRLLDALRSAPPPTDAHQPSDWPGCTWVDKEFHVTREPMAMFFTYPNDAERVVVARIESCTRWQSYVTTGSYTRRINKRVLTALPPVWTQYPDPGSMRVHG